MKTLKLIIPLLLFCVLISNKTYTQNTYTVSFENNYVQNVSDFIITDQNRIIAVGSETQTRPYTKGKIWAFTNQNDTLTRTYQFGDTICSFGSIIEDSYNEDSYNRYIVSGYAYLPPDYEYESCITLLLVIDSDLNIIDKKFITPEDYNNFTSSRLYKFNDVYYSFGHAKVPDSVYYSLSIPHNVKYDKNLNVIKMKEYEDIKKTWLDFQDCIFSKDSTQIYAFTWGYYSNTPSITIYDTNLNFIRYKEFPMVFNPQTVQTELHYEGFINTKWISDSTFIVGALHGQTDFIQGSHINSLGFSELDTTLPVTQVTYLGNPDTINYPGYNNSFDFRNSDSIFFVGTHDIFNRDVSWIMTGRLNRDLEIEEIYYYGGDKHYKAKGVRCTNDGGYVISANYESVNTPGRNVMFMKLDNKCKFTSNNQEAFCPPSLFTVSPNPSDGNFKIHLAPQKAFLKLYNMQGQMVYSADLTQGINTINLDKVNKGVYLCRVETKHQSDVKKIIIK
ncbi:MAG: T9SS type A sorting domain-containing protein [Bacteroidales bacterium]